MRRRPTVYPLPEYDGPTFGNVTASAEVEQLRAEEAALDRMAAHEQLLSRRLSHLYGRDVRCARDVSWSTLQARLGDGTVGITSRLPSERYMRKAPYLDIAVSADMANRLLERDEHREAA